MAGRTGERARTVPTPPPPTAASPKAERAKAVKQARDGRRLTGGYAERESALTAAAQVYESDGSVTATAALTAGTDVSLIWQTAVLGYARAVPELSAATMFVGNACSMVELELGRRNIDGTTEPAYRDEQGDIPVLVEGLDPKVAAAASEAIARIRMEIGGQSEFLRSYAEKAFLLGESFIVPRDTPGGLTFDPLSRFEVRRETGGRGKEDKWFRVLGPGQRSDEPLDAPPIRVYRPDPQWSMLPTSSPRGCLEILEELVILTRLVRGSALSRMSLAGMLIIADEADDPIDNLEGADDAEASNPLLVDIINAGIKAIDDPASPAAFMPYMLQIPKDLVKDGVEYIQFEKDDSISIAKRDEAVARLARGLDMPYEKVVGHQSTTFANAAQVDLDSYRIHIQPLLKILADAAVAAIVWPAVAKALGLDPAQVRQNGYPPEVLAVGIHLNPAKLVAQPDRTKDLIEAYRFDQSQTAIANAELRGALGLDPNGGPDDDEIAKRVSQIQLVKERITVASPTNDTIDDPSGATPILPVVASADEALIGLVYRIAGAAEQTVERAVEKVGAKARQRARGTEAEMLGGRANHEVPRILGPERTQRLVDGDPVAVEVDAFTRLVLRWAVEAAHPQPNVVADTFSAFLTGVISKRLYELAPEVSPEMVRPLVLGVTTAA